MDTDLEIRGAREVRGVTTLTTHPSRARYTCAFVVSKAANTDPEIRGNREVKRGGGVALENSFCKQSISALQFWPRNKLRGEGDRTLKGPSPKSDIVQTSDLQRGGITWNFVLTILS